MTRLAALVLLAASLAPAPAHADEPAAPDAFADLRPLIGGWSGRMICDDGNFSIGMAVEDKEGKIAARYSTIMVGTSAKAAGSATLEAGAKPGKFTAGAQSPAGQATVRIAAAEKGRLLIFSPDPAMTGLLALIKFSGTARLDKARANARIRYTMKTPIGVESCSGTMAKVPAAN